MYDGRLTSFSLEHNRGFHGASCRSSLSHRCMLGGECDCWLRDSDEADYEEDQQVCLYSPVEPYIVVGGALPDSAHII